ncbi:hypothetical protein M422DRAFT_244809 [Sphaerobolus stellatus SS14]|nr:hypothetical protein M422DRAFT_244809 [Sphaerobolus stellatus SS14]
MIVSVSLAALAVGLRHKTNPALLGIGLSNLTNLTNLLSMLLSNWASVENGTVSLQRIHEIVNLPAEGSDGETPDKRSSYIRRISIAKDEAWPVHGSVKFQDFSMKYRNDLPPVLRDINFSIRGGTKLGICGRTGSGKSSMILALFRAYPFTTGKITIDGIDISRLDLHSLRSELSVVSQEPFLWHAPLRDNLDPARLCADDILWAALRRVGMSDAISKLPGKLEALIEESSLSRGEKQLLCMARVLLRQRQIVILDEATSSLDFETDKRIREIIQTDLSDKTIIAVAHRIATIVEFDMVIVLDSGSIVEMGNPRELLSDPASKFRRLAASQGISAEEDREDYVWAI